MAIPQIEAIVSRNREFVLVFGDAANDNLWPANLVQTRQLLIVEFWSRWGSWLNHLHWLPMILVKNGCSSCCRGNDNAFFSDIDLINLIIRQTLFHGVGSMNLLLKNTDLYRQCIVPVLAQ